jgi:hypothetical protein
MCLNITERVARLQYYAPESVELHDETVASAVAAVRQQRGQRRALRHLLLIETRDEQSLEAAQQLRRTRRRLKRSTELTLPSDLRENLDSLVRRRLRFYQPATDDAEDRLLVELVDFPLAPELSGVFMGVLCKPVSRRRSQSAQLFERRMMEEAREIDVTAALALIPSLGYLVRRARSSLAWREYAPGRSAWPVVRSATTVADNGEPDNSA